jgi:putative ABC transport system substrate-binding protein
MALKPAVGRLTIIMAILLLAAQLGAGAQQPAKLPRIGVLTLFSSAEDTEPFRRGLRELGYVEGQNIAIEWRAGQQASQYRDAAAELVSLEVDIIVAASNAAVAAAQRATKTIPIVMVYPTDPVGLGFVASLARPGSNITGLSGQSRELQGKRLQILKDIVPRLSRVGILWDPTEPGRQAQAKESEAAARTLGVAPQFLEVRSPEQIDSVFATMTRDGSHAVLVGGSSMLRTHRARIAGQAVKSRLPTMCPQAWFVEAGCLVSYGTHFPDLFRRAAYFVDAILKGAKPADLPVQQPTKFELVINTKTAKALGLAIPPSLLLQADRMVD